MIGDDCLLCIVDEGHHIWLGGAGQTSKLKQRDSSVGVQDIFQCRPQATNLTIEIDIECSERIWIDFVLNTGHPGLDHQALSPGIVQEFLLVHCAIRHRRGNISTAESFVKSKRSINPEAGRMVTRLQDSRHRITIILITCQDFYKLVQSAWNCRPHLVKNRGEVGARHN